MIEDHEEHRCQNFDSWLGGDTYYLLVVTYDTSNFNDFWITNVSTRIVSTVIFDHLHLGIECYRPPHNNG